MKLPTPNANEVSRFRQIYQEECGITLTPSKAYEALASVMAFIYLTEYEPVVCLKRGIT